MYCPNCGHENDGNAKFCQNCGNPFDNSLSDETGAENQLDTVLSSGAKAKAKNVETKTIGKVLGIISICIIIAISVLVVCLIAGIDIFPADPAKEIIGAWEISYVDDESYSGYVETNFHDITDIRFFEDGTLMIDGLNGSETGNYSIEGDTLKVTGDFGGMFWDYSGFVGTFSISSDGDYLRITVDDEGCLFVRTD